MNSLAFFKVQGILVTLAVVLGLAPASRAQSEIAPDHFDGTDSWEAGAHHKLAVTKSRQERRSDPSQPSQLTLRRLPAAHQQTQTRQVTVPRLFRSGAKR
jgi:hypothetical protein